MPLYTADVLCATAFGKDLGMLETRNTGLVQDVKKLGWRCGNVVIINTKLWVLLPTLRMDFDCLPKASRALGLARGILQLILTVDQGH